MNSSGGLDTAGGLWMGSGQFAELFPGNRVHVQNSAALGVLLTGLCTGMIPLLAFLIALVCRMFPHRHLTVFMVSLVLTSFLQAVSSSLMVMNLLSINCNLEHCHLMNVAWQASRRSGVLLHLLVALEFFCGKFHLGPKLQRVHVTVPVVFLVNLICLIFNNVMEASIFLGAVASNLMCLLLVLACMLHKGDRKLSMKVLASAFISFWGTYFPSFVLECMIVGGSKVSMDLYITFLCLTNVRLLMDGYLCTVICRRPLQEALQQGLEGGHVNLDTYSQVKV